MKSSRLSTFTVLSVLLQIVIFILFYCFVTYYEEDTIISHSDDNNTYNVDSHSDHALTKEYKWEMFVHVHIMIFIGIGFIMVFLKNYGYSAVSLNLLVGAFSIEWGILIGGFFRMKDFNNTIPLTMYSMFDADFSAAAVLISFATILGRIGPVQLLLLVIFEVPLLHCNIFLNEHYFHAADIGGSMAIHVFAAYYGLAISLMLYYKTGVKNADHKITTSKTSDLFSMVGTVFLWICWPSFNAALTTTDDGRHRARVNTYVALCGGTIASFVISSLSDSKKKFHMDHVQNATLAAGVAVGAVANLIIGPFAALLTGFIGGAISTLGFAYLSSCLKTKCCLYDTCGVHNLHGLPGILSGLASIVSAAATTKEDVYGFGLDGRSPSTQAGYQVAFLVTSMVIPIVGGLISGIILRLPVFDQPMDKDIYEDDVLFHLPTNEELAVNVTENIGADSDNI